MFEDVPEPGTKAKVQTDDGEETAVHTGIMWASEDGSRIIENVKSWEEIPDEGELEIKELPDKLEEPPVGGASAEAEATDE